MTVYKRAGSPFWQASFVNPVSGERERASTKQRTERAAKMWLDAHLDALRGEARELKEGGRVLTLAEALDAYVGSLEAAGKASVDMWQRLREKALGRNPRMARRFHLDGRKPLHLLEPLDLERLVAARRAEGNGPATICHELKLLRAASRYAKSLRYRSPDLDTSGGRNPWRMPKVEQKTRYLSWDEWLRVYDAMDPGRIVTRRGSRFHANADRGMFDAMQDSRDLLVALTMCGARWSEVARMTWAKVVLTPEEEVAAQIAADPDGPVVYGRVSIKGVKGGKERPVPVPAQFYDVLRRRRDKAPPDAVLVFPGRTGGARVRSSAPIRFAIERAGCNTPDTVRDYGRATVHSLRHTFASWALQNGADLSEVQEVLGHANIMMTRRYAHLSKRQTVDKLGGLMSRVVRLA